MKKKIIYLFVTFLVGAFTACEPNKDLFPLPYDNRETGSYLRVYKITSNVWDINDLTGSGFEAIYESVDRNFGADLVRVDFFATHRSGATGFITNEVLVKTLTASAMGFAKVPKPSYSEYLRSTPIKITATETLAALATLTTDPDGTTCSNIFPDVCPAVAFPGSLSIGDRIIFRVKIYDKQGRTFTVNNPQVAASPRLGNSNEANITPNLTGGQFYNSPMLYTTLIQQVTTTGNTNAYTGTYRMAQVGRWVPDLATNANNLQILRTFAQGWMRPFVFGNSTTDSTQTVTLSLVPGGLSSQRQLTCNYRGQSITMIINLEQAVLNVTGAGYPGATPPAALATMQAATTAGGLGFPAGTTNANLGTVFVSLANTGINCTSERQFYQMTAGAAVVTAGNPGTFSGDAGMPLGIPRRAFPNRGHYRTDRDGLTPGDVFTITVDDDVDEYGRRNGYCNWYTRIALSLTKL
ncbi:MAG: hypothetical protein JNM78_10370 [Cyclobacteriaceae bacterium]|nr:hypothetical protein [Cyclobacteriaceae bacterium]